MNVLIGPNLEEQVRNKVESGSYASASDVVCEALWLLQERDRLYLLQRGNILDSIASGMASLRAGNVVDEESVLARIENELDAADREDPV